MKRGEFRFRNTNRTRSIPHRLICFGLNALSAMLVLGSCVSAQAGERACHDIFAPGRVSVSEREIRIVVEEMAQRFVDIAEMVEPVGRSLAFAELRQRVLQAEDATGHSLRQRVADRVVELRKNQSSEEAKVPKSQRVASERSRFVHGGDTLFESDVDQLGKISYQMDWWARELEKPSWGYPGIQWSLDERFFLVRNEKLETRIFDSLKGRFLSRSFNPGTLSESGPYYAEVEGDGFVVHNIESDEKWGPFQGSVRREGFNSRFVIAFDGYVVESSATRGNTRVPKYRVVDFKSGRDHATFEHSVSYSSDYSKVGGFVSSGTAKIIDLDGKTSPREILGAPFYNREIDDPNSIIDFQIRADFLVANVEPEKRGIFSFGNGGRKDTVAFRLADGKKFKIQGEVFSVEFTRDGQMGVAVTRVSDPRDPSKIIRGALAVDILTGQAKLNRGFGRLQVTDGGIFAFGSVQSSGQFIDPRTLEAQPPAEPTGGMSVYADPTTGARVSSPGSFLITPLGAGDYALLEPTFRGGGGRDQGRKVEIRRVGSDGIVGEILFSAQDMKLSPSGQHLFVVDGRKIRLQTFQPE